MTEPVSRDQKYWNDRNSDPSITSVGLRSFRISANDIRYRALCSAMIHLLSRLHIPQNASFLDAGAGTGIIIKCVYDAGYRGITAADISAQALSRIEEPVQKVVTSLEKLSEMVNDSYDVVYCFDVLYHITDNALFAEAIRSISLLSREYILVHGYFPRFVPLWLVRHARFRTLRAYDREFSRYGFARVDYEPTFFVVLRLPFYRLFGWFPRFWYDFDRVALAFAKLFRLSFLASHQIVVYERRGVTAELKN